jgi:hypothetical protein
MKFKTNIALGAIMFLCVYASAQTTAPRQLPAIRINLPIKIDGLLNDSAWKTAPKMTDLVEFRPKVGARENAENRTETWLLYSDEGIYFGGYCHERTRDSIATELSGRDGFGTNDYIGIIFDTYYDKINGFEYFVTPLNEQWDAKMSPGDGNNGGEDFGWNAVWESGAVIHNDGWSFEMFIPFSAIRFSKKEVQTWGLNITRRRRKTEQQYTWNPIDPNVNGFLTQEGTWAGITNIKPPLRLQFSPYLSTYVNHFPQKTAGVKDWTSSVNGGMDVKYGLNQAFTLDATLVPDFGQVQSDNRVLNLTPFEVRYQENRPFFTEGTEIFNKAGLFYSRRVGATPTRYNDVRFFVASNPGWDMIKNPTTTQLYNATKFSGRTKKKLGIGIFNAVTAPAYAKLRNTVTGKDSTIQTEPLANYNILVLDQALKGRSSITFTNTNVIRNAASPDANVTALDFSLFDKSNVYNVRGTARYSKVFSGNGTDGFNTTLRFAKVSGNWQYNIQGNVESANYNPRDLGFLQAPNEVSVNSTFGYYHFQPSGALLQYNYRINAYYSRMYQPGDFNRAFIRGTAFWIFRNFWDVTLTAGYFPTENDYFVLGDPATYRRFVKRPSYGYVESSGSTDSRKRLYVRYSAIVADFFNSAPNKAYHAVEGGFRYRFSNRFTLDLSHRHEGETDYIIYAGREINNEPIVAFVDFTDVTSILSGIYNFTPRVNLTLRGRHYLSRVQFNRYANVDQEGNTINKAGNANYSNVNVFNLDAFLTWDFRLGSRLIAGYKNWLGDEEIINPTGKNNYLNNLRGTFGKRHGNEFTIRFIYFLDYNQLRKKS